MIAYIEFMIAIIAIMIGIIAKASKEHHAIMIAIIPMIAIIAIMIAIIAIMVARIRSWSTLRRHLGHSCFFSSAWSLQGLQKVCPSEQPLVGSAITPKHSAQTQLWDLTSSRSWLIHTTTAMLEMLERVLQSANSAEAECKDDTDTASA